MTDSENYPPAFDYDATRHDAHGRPVPEHWEPVESRLVSHPQTLSLRRSHQYVGTWQDLDRWESIGSYMAVAWCSWSTDPDDMCEPIANISRVWVNTGSHSASIDDIKQALRDTLTQSGCSHEYDCCGCRSYYVSRCDYEPESGEWLVTVSSSRNY